MPDQSRDNACLNCGRTQADVPISTWQYQDKMLHICIDCMPTFIHKREQVMAKWTVSQQAKTTSGE